MSTSAISFRCIRCGTSYPADRDYFGCPSCAAEGLAVNLEVDYAEPLRIDPREWERRPRGLWRYDSALPLRCGRRRHARGGRDAARRVRDHRGGDGAASPAGEEREPEPDLVVQGPARLAGDLVGAGARPPGRRGLLVRERRRHRRGVRGPRGAAVHRLHDPELPGANGALHAELRCAGRRRAVRSRTLDAQSPGSEQWGFLPVSNLSNPPLGSHPVAIEGCKTIAYELVEDLGGAAPDVVIIPVAYGDSISGIYRGFRDLVEAGVLERLPRLVAAEAYPSLSTALRENAELPPAVEGSGSDASSVATPQGTLQALRAIRESGGTAVAVSNERGSPRAHRAPGARGAARRVQLGAAVRGRTQARCRGELSVDECVVALITSSGLKDPETMFEVGELPLAEPTLREPEPCARGGVRVCRVISAC